MKNQEIIQAVRRQWGERRRVNAVRRRQQKVENENFQRELELLIDDVRQEMPGASDAAVVAMTVEVLKRRFPQSGEYRSALDEGVPDGY